MFTAARVLTHAPVIMVCSHRLLTAERNIAGIQ